MHRTACGEMHRALLWKLAWVAQLCLSLLFLCWLFIVRVVVNCMYSTRFGGCLHSELTLLCSFLDQFLIFYYIPAITAEEVFNICSYANDKQVYISIHSLCSDCNLVGCSMFIIIYLLAFTNGRMDKAAASISRGCGFESDQTTATLV